jgi:hypothetical protein
MPVRACLDQDQRPAYLSHPDTARPIGPSAKSCDAPSESAMRVPLVEQSTGSGRSGSCQKSGKAI